MNEFLNYLLKKNLEDDSFVNVFACDDKKKDLKRYNFFYNLKSHSFEKIFDECTFYNIATFGSFISLNPLSQGSRKKEFIKKLNFVFIDLDHAKKDDLDGVLTFLKSKDIKPTYTAETGGGYHVVLDVDLEKEKEQKVKDFLVYLHTHICSKVDTSTGDMTRLMRVPESKHYKGDEKELKTLYFKKPNDKQIKENSEIIQSFKIEELKEETNTQYQLEIKREDSFFSEILNNSSEWKQYKKYLNKATMRNPIFLKNLGIFLKNNLDYKQSACLFIETWEKSRVSALEGWIKKAFDSNMSVNYPELLKWVKENGLTDWEDLLRIQLKDTFLDEYEVYFLEEEKAENNCILFFPKKNYYVQKSLNEVIINIFYDCKERGLDLEKELKLNLLFEKWDTFSFKKQMSLILDQIRRVLEQENRIKLIYNINYSPIDEKFIRVDNKKFFNIYKKSNLLSLETPEASEFDFKHIKELILNLCGNNQEYYNWFIQWLGFQIQNPTAKLPTATIFQGEQGTGKGVLKTQILDSIFGNNCQEINQTHLESSFNEYLLGKQIIVANEVMHNENRQTLPNILKNLVTDEFITIQRKFRKDLVIRNYTHWIFCTNSDNPIKIDGDDRRYSVFKSKKLKGGGVKAQKFVKELIENKEHELPHFLKYLKELDVDEFFVSNPIETEAKKDIQELNKNSLERFIDYLRDFSDLKKSTDTLINGKFTFVQEETSEGGSIPTDLLYLIYEAYCDKFREKGVFNKLTFSKKLRTLNIESKPRYFPNRKTTVKSLLVDELNKIIEINC